eukprot:s195_g5.t1
MAMATAAEVSTVEGFITKCDIEGLQQLVSENYNWNQNLADFTSVPLVHAITEGLSGRKRALRPKYLVMIEWMVRSGADPHMEMSKKLVYDLWQPSNEDATKLSLHLQQYSMLSFVLKLSELLQLGRGGADWSEECAYLDDIITIFKNANKSSKPSDDSSVRIHTDVGRLWEIAREMTSTHNVVFQTAEGEISAHDHILIAASPVLKAMLESPMREASTKCIPVKDSSRNGVSLFLDLLYTSSTCLELDYRTMLTAFDVAHRWQVPHVVNVLADALRKELTVDSFVEIAEAAMLKGTASLQQACATFGAKNHEIQTSGTSEAENTDKMRAHALKARTVDGLRHEDVDLMVCTDLIDQTQTCVLNHNTSLAGVLEVLQANPEDKALSSDADPQMIIKVVFKEKVNISSVTIRFPAPPKSDDDETYAKPRLLKFFCNQEDLDFSDIEEIPATAEKVVEEDATEAKMTCIGHKFQRLSSIQILVEEAMDPEATRSFVNRISLVGHKAQSYHAEYSG